MPTDIYAMQVLEAKYNFGVDPNTTVKDIDNRLSEIHRQLLGIGLSQFVNGNKYAKTPETKSLQVEINYLNRLKKQRM